MSGSESFAGSIIAPRRGKLICPLFLRTSGAGGLWPCAQLPKRTLPVHAAGFVALTRATGLAPKLPQGRGPASALPVNTVAVYLTVAVLAIDSFAMLLVENLKLLKSSLEWAWFSSFSACGASSRLTLRCSSRLRHRAYFVLPRLRFSEMHFAYLPEGFQLATSWRNV